MARRIFFWVLVIAFFIITPLLIGYALGYRYNFNRGVFVFAGSITIKANPERVSIEVNGQPTSNQKLSFLNGSYHINGLRPGEYSVRVFQDGFQEWKKIITVQSGISTEFWNILLPRNDYPNTLYPNTDSATRFFPAPKSNLFAVARKNPDTDFSLHITLTDTSNNSSKEIYSSDTEKLTNDTLQNIEWSPREDFLLVPIETLPKISPEKINPASSSDYLLLPVKNTYPVFLSTLLPINTHPSVVRWSPEEKDVLYYLNDGSLWKIPVTEKTIPILVAKDVLGYDFYTGNIIVLRKENHILYHYGLDVTDEPIQITTTSLSENNTDPHRIIAYDDRKLAFINSQKELFIHNAYKDLTFTKKLASGITGAQFSNDGKKILFWNDREVFVYFMEKWETQPQRAEDTLIQVARFFDPITNVQWTKDYEHILFNQGSVIKTLGLDTRGGQDGYTLKTLVKKDSQIFMSGHDDKIYFTDEIENRTQFLSIDFPESLNLFGF